jgi:transcriptional regulator with XRE-family HTH domain
LNAWSSALSSQPTRGATLLLLALPLVLGDRVRQRLDGNLGELIRDARERARLSQSGLADAIGTTQSAVSRWERGHETPRADTLVEILRACGFEADIVARPRDSGVDRAQVRAHLRMTPRQRLRQVETMNAFAKNARRVS